ncbi:hypothetical protein QUF80_16670 [Desulfococcaceae bacterium HSG8]|nr:hypothetical protein [Desulfococcaceae bacterium HSG8]
MKRKKINKKRRIKITPSSIVGVLLGLLLMGGGIYIGFFNGEYFGYFSIALGLFLIILVIIVSRARTR